MYIYTPRGIISGDRIRERVCVIHPNIYIYIYVYIYIYIRTHTHTEGYYPRRQNKTEKHPRPSGVGYYLLRDYSLV